jgi:hypothetical protein
VVVVTRMGWCHSGASGVLLILKEEEGELVVVVICMSLATDISKTSIYLHMEHIYTVRFTQKPFTAKP